MEPTDAPRHASFAEFYPFYLSLARLEGRIAIGRFLQRFPDYRLTAAPVRGGRARFRGFLSAPFAIR